MTGTNASSLAKSLLRISIWFLIDLGKLVLCIVAIASILALIIMIAPQ